MSKQFYEIFEEVAAAESREAKRLVLKKYQSKLLETILVAMFHPDVSYVFKKVPKYNPSDAPVGMGYSNFLQEFPRMYVFQDQTKPLKDVWRPFNPKICTIPLKRREELLIQILEALEAKEAALFAAIIERNVTYKGLTYKLVKDTFSGLLP